jgi:preprotein translocase subunit YajC
MWLRVVAVALFLSTGALAQLPAPQPVQQPVPVVQSGPVAVVESNQAMWIAVATSVVGLLGTVFTGLMAFFMARLNKQADAATQIAQTGLDKGEKILVASSKTLEVATASHILLNHDRHVILQSNAVLARRIAEITKSQADIKTADDADKAVIEHDLGQARADAKKGRIPVVGDRRAG